MTMEEGERDTPSTSTTPQNKGPPSSTSAANGRLAGSGGKGASPPERSGGGGGAGFAGIAKMLSSKAKGQGPKGDGGDGKGKKQNGCEDDLPLGSEAHSLSFEHTNGIDSKGQAPAEKRSRWSKTVSQGMMGWQSFNSDASNQTSASSASLEMLLNERQMDPEEMLLNLGFGGQTQTYVPSLARVPERFLVNPSRAYGIAATGNSEEGGEEVAEDSNTTSGTPQTGGGGGGTTSMAAAAGAAAPPPKKRTGIWTLARTLSLLRMKTPSIGQGGGSSHASGTSSPLASQIVSILHPANQRYLASRGYYEKQGWPRGTFLEAEEQLLRAAQEEEEESKDAASKRKMFQKARSKRNWSMCDPENENDDSSGQWISKSMDDSLSREDSNDHENSLGRGNYFSTTTESSTDSLDTPNIETEKAFEEIRRQYNESRRKDRSSSEDLFLPRRRKRLSSDIIDDALENDNDSDEEQGLDLLDAGNIGSPNYFVSPASSRQATVEKAPTIRDHSINEEGEHTGAIGSKNDDNNNKNLNSPVRKVTSPRSRKFFASESDGYHEDGEHSPDVRIIVSGAGEQRTTKHITRDDVHTKSPSKLTVESAQRASSDSGSSSSGTAVGSNSVATATEDTDARRWSESENSITDHDSISRTHSPYGFSHGADRFKHMVSSSCQTTDSDFKMAADAMTAANRNEHSGSVASRSENARKLAPLQIGQRSGAHSPTPVRRGRDFAQLEESPKVQLSAIPPAINPLELMKRLRHSQDELSRMGSIQSDSSGFGDADPTADPGQQDIDAFKVASLGSSSESSGTLASSVATAIHREPRRGEIATQTSVDSSKGKSGPGTPRGLFDKEQFKQSPKPTGEGARYVTMCYIPSLTSRSGQPEGLRFRGGAGGGAMRGSKPITDLHYPHRPRGDSDPALDFGPQGQFRNDEIDYGRPQVYSDMQYGQQQYDPRWRGYGDSPRMYPYDYPDFHGDRPEHYAQYRLQNQPGYGSAGSSEMHARGRAGHADRDFASGRKDTSQRTFTSHIDLYANESGVHRRDASFYSRQSRESFRRHSDEGILEGRNDTPLSMELAQAMKSGAKEQTRTTATTNTNSNVIASTSVYIHPTSSTSNTLTTPARYKTETGFHFPPLAGNLSGFQADLHSTPINSSRSPRPPSSRQKSCDILEDDFREGDPISAPDPPEEISSVHINPIYNPPSFNNYPTFPKRTFPPSPWHDTSPVGPYTYSLPHRSHSRASDDFETHSSVAETSSDFSMQSMPEGHTKTGILDSRKLARLINQPMYYKGQRRCGSHYRPRRLFKEWSLLSKRKRLQEENRLLQYAIQKYKTELSIMETAFMVDYQATHGDLTDEEREEVEELEWLWGEVKGQVMEMERLLVARVKSVHAGNDFHSLMSSMGVINRMIDIIREQLYQQQIANNREEERREEEFEDELEFYEDEFGYPDRRRGSFQSSHSWMAGAGGVSTPQSIRRFQSSSTSHIPTDLNLSLEQIKSSLLSEVQNEIKQSTKRLEMDLQEKDKEIKKLQEQLVAKSTDAVNKSPRRWTPKPPRPRSTEGQQQVPRSNSKSRLVGDKVVQETDV